MAEADPDEVFETLRDLGLPEEAVRRAVERGRPEDAIFESVLLPEIADRTVSANDVVARGGPPLVQIEGFWDAFGLPIDDPDEPRFSEEEAEIFLRLNEMQDVWPPEVGLQVARVYGRLLARIAQTEIQVFREYVQPRLRSDGDPVAAMLATRDAFAQLLPTTGPLLLGVHRRWVGLGDGYMLVYADGATALEVGRRVIAAMRASDADLPAIHCSAHTGTAIAREGDFFGGAVNLAARLLGAAGGDELVATEATVEAGGEAFDWDPAGSVGVRGVAEPVEVFRLRG